MSISKKERSLSIWIGIAIGVALSSLLVRYALEKKATQTRERLGNYKSLKCASDESPFISIPLQISKKIPHGIVVYFENNQTEIVEDRTVYQRSWVIETAGSFRSERLFILAQEKSPRENFEDENNYLFYRASEVYLYPVLGVQKKNIEDQLDSEQYKIIGKHSKTGAWILQIKDFSPSGLRNSISMLSDFEGLITSVQLMQWFPNP